MYSGLQFSFMPPFPFLGYPGYATSPNTSFSGIPILCNKRTDVLNQLNKKAIPEMERKTLLTSFLEFKEPQRKTDQCPKESRILRISINILVAYLTK